MPDFCFFFIRLSKRCSCKIFVYNIFKIFRCAKVWNELKLYKQHDKVTWIAWWNYCFYYVYFCKQTVLDRFVRDTYTTIPERKLFALKLVDVLFIHKIFWQFIIPVSHDIFLCLYELLKWIKWRFPIGNIAIMRQTSN